MTRGLSEHERPQATQRKLSNSRSEQETAEEDAGLLYHAIGILSVRKSDLPQQIQMQRCSGYNGICIHQQDFCEGTRILLGERQSAKRQLMTLATAGLSVRLRAFTRATNATGTD